MKRHLATTVAIALILVLSAGQIPVLCLSLNAPPTSRGAERSAPLRSSHALKQDPAPAPRPAGESVTLLPDGRTLFLGGEGPEGPRASAEIRDDRSGAVTRLAEGLKTARSWHTATVLPDGLVLILGGHGIDGRVINGAELFDPENQSFQLLPAIGLTPRAYHMATLLTDGRLLVTGGCDSQGRAVKRIETWEHETKTASVLKARLQAGRRKGTATLQADGTVFLSGGSDQQEASVAGSEIYDPANGTVTWTPTAGPANDDGSARLLFSSPANGDLNVDPKISLALRFSKRLKPETINRETVKLSGPRGEVPSKIVSAESGRLLFVTPLAALAADSSYHLQIDGPAAIDDQKLEFTAINFKTKPEISCPNEPLCGGAGPQIIDADTWIPSANNPNTSGRSESSSESLPPLQAAAGETALAGQVLALSGSPLSNVTLQIGDRIAVTDGTGRFLLSGLQSGRPTLTIQGHTASRPGKMYGTFDVQVDVAASKTTVLPYKIWLPVLDEQNAVALPIPTHRELGVTTPRVPGMEVRIPSNAVLRMPPGAHHSHGMKRQELTSVSITPMPADRPPFPLPPGVNDVLLFTLQLHGAKVEGPRGEKRPGLRIVFPNYKNLPAGARVDFWNYDSGGPGWYMYGHGTVTPDRRQVIPDPGVELQSMHCASFMDSGGAGSGPAFGGGAPCCDPIDMSTGLFIYEKTDLVLPDVIPILLSRTYRQNDSTNRSFGKGATNPYDMFIFGNTATYGEIILPDGGRIHFDRIPNSNPALYEHVKTPTRFYKATMRMITGVGPNGAWEVKLLDGTIYQFGIKVLFGDILGVHASTTGLSVIQDRYGNKLTVTRDSNFRMSRITSPNGRWIEFSYIDSSKRIAQATDNTGRVVSYTYDAGGRLWKVTDAKGGITEYTYDANDRMLTIKDPRNIVYLTNEYDPASGRITRQTQADNGFYQLAYTVNGSGKVTQADVTDPRGFVRRTTFNADGYTLTDTYGLGTPQQQTYTYERQAGSNFMTSVTDPMSRRTELAYDTLGNLTSVTRLAGTAEAIATTFTYEPTFNQIATVTDPLNHTTSATYDTLGRLTTITDPLNHPTTFTHNASGQILTATDPLNQVTQFTYDSGDLVTITDRLNRTWTRYIDGAGRLTRVTNPLGDVMRYEYDNFSQQTSRVDAAQGVTSVAYNPNGNVLSVTDARNSVTSYVYNNMERVATRRDPLLREETYQYDLNGNLTEFRDRKNQLTQYAYDPLNRLTQVTYADSSTTSYAYDNVNRLTEVVDSLSGTITYGYDNLDRLTSETTPQGTVSYVYDAAGRRTSMTVTGQPTITYSYDNADRLTQITQGASTVTIAYDAAGRRTSLTLANGLVTEYGYDAASQLTSLTYKQGATTLGDLTYEYDANGRRTKMGGSFARSITSPALSSASYNSVNQQLSFGSQTLAYDLNGNLLSDDVNTYTWDARNRLVNISGPNVNASFQYDALGRRTSKTVNGNTTSFLYDEANIVQEQSAQLGNANILNGGIDEKFARTDSSGIWSPLSDGLGSTLSLTDNAGVAQSEYSYGAFGDTAQTGADSSHSAQYTGRENDATGLYYYRARYYSPSLQRFISEDPVRFRGGDVNFYAYVKNDPMNFIDPMGLSQESPEKEFPTKKEMMKHELEKLALEASTEALSLSAEAAHHAINAPVSEGPIMAGQAQRTTIYSDGRTTIYRSASGSYFAATETSHGVIRRMIVSRGPQGAAGPILGAGIGILSVGPELYNTLHIIDCRNQKINDALRHLGQIP